MRESRTRFERCPRCASGDVRPIVYGLPSDELASAAMRGEVVLGGCMITGEDPGRSCASCGHRW